MIQNKIVICGGGIMGASAAYFLTLRGIRDITVIERTAIGSSASGKAGGFLAKNWGNKVTSPMHVASFNLHVELAKTLGVESFRTIETLGCGPSKKKFLKASWLKAGGELMDKMENTAQVDPFELTTKLMDAAKEKGANVIIGKYVQGPVFSENGKKIIGVRLSDNSVIDCDTLILTMGAWTTIASHWFNLPIPIDGIKSTSIVYKQVLETTSQPFALFCEEDKNDCHLEVYPRINGEVYVCGLGGSDIVQGERLEKGGDCESPEKVLADPVRVSKALESLSAITPVLSNKPDISQACLRPCSPDALPIMGQMPGHEGAYICAAHNCWGILWAPISGLAMSELIIDGKSFCLNLTPYSVERFMPAEKQRGRKKNTTDVGEQW
jgi:glycine/D-amino acid oxidase-like deaminating enzyme